MIDLLLLIYMAVAARMSGGGLYAHLLNKKGATSKTGEDLGGVSPFNLTWLPEVFFALPFGIAGFAFADGALAILLAAAAVAWSYLWMQTGIGEALIRWVTPTAAIDKDHTLTGLVDWMAEKLGIAIESRNYSRLFMAVKGFLIGLPVGGLPLAVLWPASYELGYRYKLWFRPHPQLSAKSHALSELASGVGAASAIILFRHLFLA